MIIYGQQNNNDVLFGKTSLMGSAVHSSVRCEVRHASVVKYSLIRHTLLSVLRLRVTLAYARRQYYVEKACGLNLWNDIKIHHLATSSCQRPRHLLDLQKKVAL